jgi:Electron transfer DM13
MTDSDQEQAVVRAWWRPRWYELAPELVLVAGLTLFLVDEPDAATSAFKSTRAVVLMVVAAGGWIVGRVALARLVPWRAARTAVVALAAIGALAVVVLPAYDNDTVVEAFPVAPAADPSTDSSTTTPPSPTSPATTAPVAVADRTPSGEPARTAPATNAPPPTTAPNEPVRLRTAPFMGIDHRASGTVSIYRAPDRRHVVGLEEFDIQSGPDYDLYVVPGTNRQGLDGGVRLDDLRGNRGTQYYEVPADVAVGRGDWTVLVWCQTFGVPVANATPI